MQYRCSSLDRLLEIGHLQDQEIDNGVVVRPSVAEESKSCIVCGWSIINRACWLLLYIMPARLPDRQDGDAGRGAEGREFFSIWRKTERVDRRANREEDRRQGRADLVVADLKSIQGRYARFTRCRSINGNTHIEIAHTISLSVLCTLLRIVDDMVCSSQMQCHWSPCCFGKRLRPNPPSFSIHRRCAAGSPFPSFRSFLVFFLAQLLLPFRRKSASRSTVCLLLPFKTPWLP